MELTWIAILASVIMALGAACVFVFAVKRDYFRNIEDTKYQVFWSDLEEPAGDRRTGTIKEDHDAQGKRRSG
jgi:hypothetical protein